MSPRARWVVVTLAALAAASLTARLGWWQLDRAAQKTALQAAIDERSRLDPVDSAALAASSAAAAQQHHRRVQLVGRWSPAHTVYLDNRQQQGSRPGFFVLTPLVLADGRALIVQRGWAARDAQDRARLPAAPTPAGEVTLHGRIAPPPARLFEFDAAASGPLRQNLDLDSFRRETGLALLPLSVLQTEPAPADGLARDWPAPLAGVSKHHGYAFQWFGLAALIVILYVRFQLFPTRRRAGH
jgi:surfeit locus 1 family protein